MHEAKQVIVQHVQAILRQAVVLRTDTQYMAGVYWHDVSNLSTFQVLSASSEMDCAAGVVSLLHMSASFCLTPNLSSCCNNVVRFGSLTLSLAIAYVNAFVCQQLFLNTLHVDFLQTLRTFDTMQVFPSRKCKLGAMQVSCSG